MYQKVMWGCGLFIILALLIFLTKKYLPSKHLKSLAFFLGLTCLVNEILGHGFLLFSGHWDISYGLPLQLCDITLFLSAFLLLLQKKELFEISYYWGVSGAINAIINPVYYWGDSGWWFFNFYLSHGLIILGPLWAIFIWNMQPNSKSILKNFLYIQLLIPIIGSLNWILGTNYMFINKPPQINSIFSFSKTPWHLLGIELGVLVWFSLLYFPFFLYRNNKIKKLAKAVQKILAEKVYTKLKVTL